jgi:hypothetical protein
MRQILSGVRWILDKKRFAINAINIKMCETVAMLLPYNLLF